MGLTEDLPQRLLELRVDRGELLLSVLTVGVVPVRTHAHRARAIQRESGDDVVEARRLHPLE